MKDTQDDNALLIPSIDVVHVAFKDDKSLEAILERIETDCRAEHYTVETLKGRERIKSQAYKIARSKTAMDKAGKDLTEDAQKLIKEINGRRNKVTARLDSLRDEIRKPLTEWEEADDKRKQGVKDKIEQCFGMRPLPASSADLRALQEQTIVIELDETWQEFVAEATKAKDAFLRHLAGKIQDAVRAEEAEAAAKEREQQQAAEIERLRQKAAESEAADQARKDAEAKAAADLAAKDAELAAMRAELEAMKQQPLPQPVGIVGTSPSVVVVDEVSAEAVGNFIDTLPAQNVATLVRSTSEGALFTEEQEIGNAILAILNQCTSRKASAAEIASAIIAGEIPHVKVTF